jgi:hypothetical protein
MPRGNAQYATAGRFWRIFFCDGRDMPAVAKPLREVPRIANGLDAVAKSAGSGGPDFTYMDGLLYTPLL